MIAVSAFLFYDTGQGTVLCPVCAEKICNFLSSKHTEFSSLPDKTELFLATQRTVPPVLYPVNSKSVLEG